MDLPIACTLDPTEYAIRREEIAQIACDALRSRERLSQGARLTFRASDTTERGIRQLIAAESQCCPFLHFDLARDGAELQLEVTGPDEAQPIIAELFAA